MSAASDDLFTFLERLTDVGLTEVHEHEGLPCLHFEGVLETTGETFLVIALGGKLDYWEQVYTSFEDAAGRTLAEFDAWLGARDS